MTDEEHEKEVKDLVEMLNNLRLIKDKGRRKWLIREAKEQLTKLINN